MAGLPMEFIRANINELDASEDERNYLCGIILSCLENLADGMYFGGMSAGLACVNNSVNALDIVPQELMDKINRKPTLTLIRGGQ